MKRVTPLLALVLVVCLSLFAQQARQEEKKEPAASAEYKIPPEAAKRENPVKPTDGSVAEGKHLHESQCAMCHGAAGDGKGDLAVTLKFAMKDWRDPEAMKNWTDGELFYVMDKGKGNMPGQEGRMKETQIWHMVNFIRSLAKKGAAPKKEGP